VSLAGFQREDVLNVREACSDTGSPTQYVTVLERTHSQERAALPSGGRRAPDCTAHVVPSQSHVSVSAMASPEPV
jgi:hypothetical protein